MSTPKIRSILVATDLEPGSDAAVHTAGRLAESAGAELHLLHALEPDPARCEAADDIAEAAGELGCDLVVLGHQHSHSIGGRVRAATLEHLVRRLAVPCLVAGGAARWPIRRALLPVDLSGSPEPALTAALAWVGALSHASGAPALDVRFLSVVPPFMRAADQPLGMRGVRRRMRRLVEWGRRLSGPGVTIAGTVKAATEVPATISRTADENGADLIVLTAHGRRSVARMLLGSVSTPVARRSRRPVLLLPQPVWSTPAEREAVPALGTTDARGVQPWPSR
jgi:nucleotide-binding universal stress UspA family protein